MLIDHENNIARQSVNEIKETQGLIDYFCPHCGEKLFRGRVSEIKMVCSHCNTLVRSTGNQEMEVTDE